MPQVSLPQGTIHYDELGPAEGPPVVFVHGFLANGELWRAAAELVAAAGARCLLPTWPLGAHAQPMHPDADLSPTGVAQIVLGFLEALDLHDVTLVGSDTGGAITQLTIDANATRVGRVALTNCDAFEQFPPRGFRWFTLGRHRGVLRATLGLSRLWPIRRLAFRTFIRKPDRAMTQAWVTPVLTDREIRRDTRKLLAGLDRQLLIDAGGRLHEFAGPVLLFWGTSDVFFTPRLAGRLQAAFTDARLVLEPGGQTFVSLDAPERLAAELAGFIGVGSSAGRYATTARPDALRTSARDATEARKSLESTI